MTCLKIKSVVLDWEKNNNNNKNDEIQNRIILEQNGNFHSFQYVGIKSSGQTRVKVYN